MNLQQALKHAAHIRWRDEDLSEEQRQASYSDAEKAFLLLADEVQKYREVLTLHPMSTQLGLGRIIEPQHRYIVMRDASGEDKGWLDTFQLTHALVQPE
jgi:hypothetical protein